MNKEKLKEAALSKLTDEEKKVLGLEPKKPRVKRNQKFKVYYMIGDADGDTTKDVALSLDNPFAKLLDEALDKLETMDGCFATQLKSEDYQWNYQNGKITEFQLDLLETLTSYEEEKETFLQKHGYEVNKKNLDFLSEFEGLLCSETEYSFLCYQGHKLS